MPAVHRYAQSAEPSALSHLRQKARDDLALLDYPKEHDWTIKHRKAAHKVRDVVIVGAGQTGLTTAFALRRERVGDVLLIDQHSSGKEGPWLTYARMHDLRTPKNVTGPDLGVPSLTPRAWFEARYGAGAWQAISSISREDWGSYLAWFRETVNLRVVNDTRLISIQPDGDYLRLELSGPEGSRKEYTRKLVLATGFRESGAVQVPVLIKTRLPVDKYAHSSDPIDFAGLLGKRVAVLGAGAAAFDNAAAALEAGAVSVDLFVRRSQVPVVNLLHWMDFAGSMGYFADMPDHYRWRFNLRLGEVGHPPPAASVKRCEAFSNFRVRAGHAWLAVEDLLEGFAVDFGDQRERFDFVICGTGIRADARLFPPLASLADDIATWGDRFTPPPGEENPVLAANAYLGPSFELTERRPGSAPRLGDIHCVNYCALGSMGNSSGAPGLRWTVPRLVGGLVRDLFVNDVDVFYEQFLDFAAPEPDDVRVLA